ncbi:MAG: hypothetical protein HY308_19765 [Gammaproteobacteria bacterium]|nr:hypothetical protein [Gammaproteobacteria bacterium]
MTIYSLSAANSGSKEGDLVFAREQDASNSRFRGMPKKNWKPIQFVWCPDDNQKRKDLVINDFVLVIGAGVDIALNKRAKTILEPALSGDAEYLPIEVVGEGTDPWYLLNVTNRIDDAISLEKSDYMELSNGKRILTRPTFIEKKIPDNRIFVYPHAYQRAVVKGELLKELVSAHKLTGLNFHLCETVEDGVLPKSAAG